MPGYGLINTKSYPSPASDTFVVLHPYQNEGCKIQNLISMTREDRDATVLSAISSFQGN